MAFEVRSFVMAGPGGVVLVDTCIPGSTELIGRAVARVGAEWRDVTDIVLTHRHFDHTGGLAETAELAIGATIWAGAEDAREIPFENGRAVRPLADGQRMVDLEPERILFSHGGEVPYPGDAIRQLLDRS